MIKNKEVRCVIGGEPLYKYYFNVIIYITNKKQTEFGSELFQANKFSLPIFCIETYLQKPACRNQLAGFISFQLTIEIVISY